MPLPWTLGADFAGAITATGVRVEPGRVGERVWVLHKLTCLECEYCLAGKDNLCVRSQMWGVDRPGGYAEVIAVTAWAAFPLAENVTFEVAAASQAGWVTAWHMLMGRGRVRPGESVLVIAAGSGVGLAALQVAKLGGAEVIATAGSERKLALALEEGADHVIDHHQDDVTTRVLKLTSGRGVDLVIDNVGGDVFVSALKTLRKDGRLVFCRAHGGAVVPFDLIEALRSEWSVIGARTGTTAEHQLIMEMVTQGKLRPRIHAALPLEQVAEAHRILEESEQFGRVVVTP